MSNFFKHCNFLKITINVFENIIQIVNFALDQINNGGFLRFQSYSKFIAQIKRQRLVRLSARIVGDLS